ncbi:MAG TPA: BlaI/MecI/CopY family transcriptional regulator [Terriglobales bacterium]|nr:BlaI/MecI/CopY family transcriptional regulator [Terriglobales bacterium]
MPPKTSAILTEAELRLMEVLWTKGASTVHQVLQALPAQPALAYNSVLTTIRILEKKGYVQHSKDGRAHVYMPRIGRQEATRSAVRSLVSRFFQNSHELLVLNLLEDKSINDEELKRLNNLLQESAKQQ